MSIRGRRRPRCEVIAPRYPVRSPTGFNHRTVSAPAVPRATQPGNPASLPEYSGGAATGIGYWEPPAVFIDRAVDPLSAHQTTGRRTAGLADVRAYEVERM